MSFFSTLAVHRINIGYRLHSTLDVESSSIEFGAFPLRKYLSPRYLLQISKPATLGLTISVIVTQLSSAHFESPRIPAALCPSHVPGHLLSQTSANLPASPAIESMNFQPLPLRAANDRC
jgi:hypothetical protein